jgi:hypothetical protein
VVHGHDGGHADLQKLRGDGLGGLLGCGGLAGLEKDQRDAVIAQHGAQIGGQHGQVPAFFELADVLGMLKAKSAEAHAFVVDAVAVKVDDVIGLADAAGAVQLFTHGRQRRRVEHVQVDEAAERLHGLDQRQGAGTMIEVAAVVILRPGGDQQDADGRGRHRYVEVSRVG